MLDPIKVGDKVIIKDFSAHILFEGGNISQDKMFLYQNYKRIGRTPVGTVVGENMSGFGSYVNYPVAVKLDDFPNAIIITRSDLLAPYKCPHRGK